MMTSFVSLDRRFIVWTDKDSGDPEVMSYLLASHKALTWEDLLAKHRVVILAEAGSGKSIELTEQARISAAARRYTFSATVQNVGRRGLADALGRAAARKLEEWRNSDLPAWFFIDSVDEAKANNVRLNDALREIADGIEGGQSRAHIVLSGRHTDWEFRRDFEQLREWIAMPPTDDVAPAIDPNELIISALRRDKAPEPPPPAEEPLVVVMAALDPNQVEAFARGKGVDDVNSFISALEKANLWDFARRPLDLEWLVEYWRTHGKFGPLADMLELSLRERLVEHDPQRARTDPIDTDRALAALERIGAALVLQGLRDIALPDSSFDVADSRLALDLADILPDWSGQDRARFVGRAVFDPSSAGLVRLHNDNEASVRSFLTARWLKRLTDSNCPKTRVADLLFATTYAVRLVIPSMRQTAAWLSLWNPDVAREVIERDPRLLMDAGDPGSLALEVREQVLRNVVEQAVAEEEFDIPDRDSLKRFALPDMAPCIRGLWAAHGGSPATREVLLLMIWLGELAACADLAVDASFGKYADRYTQTFSGRALMAVASEAEKQRYGRYVRDYAGKISSVLVWDAVEALFPTTLTVDDLMLILTSIDAGYPSDGLGLDYFGPKMAERLGSAAEIERLIAGLFKFLKAPLKPEDAQEIVGDETYLSTIEAAGRRLLELSPPQDAPALAIDAALRLSDDRRRSPRRRQEKGTIDIFSLLAATPQRRRAALWRAAERLNEARSPNKGPIVDPWEIEIRGFPVELKPEDFDWLLDDAERRPTSDNRQIAANAAMRLWRQAGERSEDLARIKAIGSGRNEVAGVVDDWTRSRSASEEQRAHEREMRRLDRGTVLKAAARDRSWLEFAARLRADPDQLRAIGPPTDKGVDARLYQLWHLLTSIGWNRSRYSIDDLTPLEAMFGPAVVAALRDAFVAYWRRWLPKLRSKRPANERNTISALDCIGIVGVSLEAAGSLSWAAELAFDDAARAAVYATLELNGFPKWFSSLAQAQPDAVRCVLTRAIAPELKRNGAADRCDELEEISRADAPISRLIADQLFEHLRQNEIVPISVLTPVLRILAAGYKDRGALASLLRGRFDHATGVQQEVAYLAPLFTLDPTQATAALDAKLGLLPLDGQTILVQNFISTALGGLWGDGSARASDVPFESLERLVLTAYKTIRIEDDRDHSDGQVYSPDARDHAESARSALFKALVETPGLATFDAIHRMSENPDFPVRRKRMMEIARDRAGSDSEAEAWTSADVCAFEEDFVTAPRNPFDLQRLVLRKLADLQYDLINDDYAQDATVVRLPTEVDVQNWMADRLRGDQGRSYSLEREPHVVEEKEPDIRFRAKASDANVPMEIKVAESWSLKELEHGLKVQLIGRYLRDRHNRYGILLLVHQKARPRGWKTEAGTWFKFQQVVDHLRELARSIAATDPSAPQAEIAVVDVSSVATTAKRRRGKAGTKAKGSGKKSRSTMPKT